MLGFEPQQVPRLIDGITTPGAISMVFPVAAEAAVEAAVERAVGVAIMLFVVFPSAVKRASSQESAFRSYTRYMPSSSHTDAANPRASMASRCALYHV